MGPHRRLLTRQEAWELLHVSESTLDRWRKTGVIPDVPLGSRTVRIDPDVIDGYIRAGYPSPSRTERASGEAA